MGTLIMQHKYLLYLLTIPQTTQFHKETVELIKGDVALVEQMTDLMTEYEADTQHLETAYSDSIKSFETEFIAGSDVSRDVVSMEIIHRINFVHNNPSNGAELNDARLLKFETEKYQAVLRQDYKAETTALRNLILDLRKHPEAVNNLGIGQLIDRLESSNEAFEQLYLIRSEALETKRQRGPLITLATKANKSFDDICMSAMGLIISRSTATMRPALESIISHINAQIHDYTTISHRHSAILARRRKKKKEENGKSDGGSTSPNE